MVIKFLKKVKSLILGITDESVDERPSGRERRQPDKDPKNKSKSKSRSKSRPKSKQTLNPSHQARIITRQDHQISRKDISENTLKVLYRLKKSGYEAYLVGGGVRDLLLGKHPKDFDVATNAKPEEIRRIFSNCRLIGRRFRLAHIHFGRDIVEVATFRKQVDHAHEEVEHSEAGLVIRDNVYGTLEEDAWRRDFTINALYYNIADFSVIDFTGGYEDLLHKKIRMIGDPAVRYREDPVRMLRAIRFAAKLGFVLGEEMTAPIAELKNLLSHISPARLFEEMIKLFHSGAALGAFELMMEYRLFEELFPKTHACIESNQYPTKKLLRQVFANTDARIQEDRGVTPVFVIAAILWHPILALAQTYIDQGMKVFGARLKAIEYCLSHQAKFTSVPKRIVLGAKEVWILQSRMENRTPQRVARVINEPRFKAAYDFLLLRAGADEPVQALADWWQRYFEGDETTRRLLLKEANGSSDNKKAKNKSKNKNKNKKKKEQENETTRDESNIEDQGAAQHE